MSQESPYLFYVLDNPQQARDLGTPASEYQSLWWQPQLTSVRPAGFALVPFAVWWLFHYVGLFFNREYTLAVLYRGGECVHRSCIFPGSFRFPFMQSDDLQIGDVWTAPSERGRGLAATMLAAIGVRFAKPGRKLWYLVHEENLASIRIAEKAGFSLHARGQRAPRWGINALGYYKITEYLPAVADETTRAA